MKPILETEAVRRLEDLIEQEGTSKAELMELAGEFAASIVEARSPKRVLVVTGFGNNGGDGWVAADILQHKGIHVDLVTPVEPDEIPSPLARHVARRTAGRDVTVIVGPSRDELVALLEKSDVVVDAILGTGFSGTVRAPFPIWIRAINEHASDVVSIDIPSGLNAETGKAADPCVSADATATMIATKIGLYSADGPEYAGEVVCGELYSGLSELIGEVDHVAEFIEASDLETVLKEIPSAVNKYSRGSVLVVAGSSTYPGAAMLAAKAAARAGAGYVSVVAPETCANLIRMALPTVPVIAAPADGRGSFGAAARSMIVELAPKYSCVLAGPGITDAAGCMQVVTGLLETEVPLILDADALNCLARMTIDGIDSMPELYRREAPLIMTPHHKELSRLAGGASVEELASAIDAARTIVWAGGSSNMVVVAKGPVTAAVGVERVLLPPAGPAALATAGSGDVLAGIIAGIVATTREEPESWELLCSYAVAVHSATGIAAAASMGPRSVIATDLIDLIGPAFDMVEAGVEDGLDVVAASAEEEEA
ncbi:NAD(P)H-hydrate dehydratase [Collinsella sp. AGMB00827]|uniref:Bifunctional NAD(P)H-hydrate repair enzyme n=1 Tax=Collinsella ureilytica TaxID=2869515 RepID=A0ABS7MJJ7_9ACTN|nr:NAD(P)H-hydrate dehydratase [Collinsella urealyticum]MBY4797260.1 NAD(P)H-hydrate dehydratase [Collinsella urealyticum]